VRPPPSSVRFLRKCASFFSTFCVWAGVKIMFLPPLFCSSCSDWIRSFFCRRLHVTAWNVPSSWAFRVVPDRCIPRCPLFLILFFSFRAPFRCWLPPKQPHLFSWKHPLFLSPSSRFFYAPFFRFPPGGFRFNTVFPLARIFSAHLPFSGPLSFSL